MRKPWLSINEESSGSLWNWMVTSEPPDTTLNLSLEPRYCPITCDVRSWPSNIVRMSLWRMFKLQTKDRKIDKNAIKPKTELNTNCYNHTLHLYVHFDALVLVDMYLPHTVLPLRVALWPVRRQHSSHRVRELPSTQSWEEKKRRNY